MITVLMATYQGKAYIKEQLDSILNQTEKDLTLLISDDRSTDGTDLILQEYKKRYPKRIELLINQTASGHAARNFFRLLSVADDNYVMLSDQDDVWLPHKAEVMRQKMEEVEQKYGCSTPILIHSNMEVVDQNLNELHPSFFSYQNVNPKRVKLSQLLVENNVTGGSLMINRALLSYLKDAPEDCFMHDWWIALIASCFGHISWIDEPLSRYRQHDSNTLGAKNHQNIRHHIERIHKGSQVQENYQRMFTQADALFHQFEKQLTLDQQTQIKAFLSLPHRSIAGRLKMVFQYGFYKTTWSGTLLQCFTISNPRYVR